MNELIKKALDEYVEKNTQINLDSEAAREELANYIDGKIIQYSDNFFKRVVKNEK